MLPGYYSPIVDQKSKERYANKFNYVNGIDPYALAKEEWYDNVHLWPAVAQVHTCMYLLLMPSPYSQNDLLNYKSIDSYRRSCSSCTCIYDPFSLTLSQKSIAI